MYMLPWMFVGHLVGDFVFQNRWMAEGKEKSVLPLLVHSLIYTACVFLCALPAGILGVVPVLLIFVTHAIIDQRGFIKFWQKTITKSEGTPWLAIVTDQAFHVVVLAVCCLLHVYLCVNWLF
jgi:hypothetical protein